MLLEVAWVIRYCFTNTPGRIDNSDFFCPHGMRAATLSSLISSAYPNRLHHYFVPVSPEL
jgi:hypothetical protein